MKYRQSLAFFALLFSLFALSARADRFLQEPANFTAMLLGMDKIQFKLPTQYDGNYNEGISDGRIYITIDGGSRQDFIRWKCSTYNELGDHKSIQVYQNGRFSLTGKCKDRSKSVFTKNDGEVTYNIDGDSDNKNHYTTTLEWTVPRELRGHRLKIELWCRSEDRNWHWFIPDGNSDATSYHEMAIVNMPEAGEASVTINEPMLAVSRDHANEVMVSYSFVVTKIFSATLHYTDAVTGEQFTQSLPTGDKVGFAYIPANRPWKDIYITARVTDAQTKETDETYRINIESGKQTSRMLHHPRSLKATMDLQGRVKLTWQVDDAAQEDISEGDFFEIQRNVTGATATDDANWKTIAMETPFKDKQTDYSFTDESLMNQYEGKAVTYRVRRSVTSMWQWSNVGAYQQFTMPWLLRLPMLTNATVQRTEKWDESGREVKVGFEKVKTDFDADGNFLVRSEDDFTRLQTLVGEGKASWDKTVFTVSDRTDWERCATQIKNGKTHIKIVLLNDLDLASNSSMIGTDNRPYEGVFEGNGHTLTFNYRSQADYAAPFMCVGNCHISDLKIAGLLSTSKKFAGGVIGQLKNDKTCTLENVYVEADFNLTIDGDASSGGMVGIMERNSTININNSAFIGRMTGSKSNCNGGFIGVALASTTINMDNCLFAPTQITTKTDGCFTFARADQTAKVTLTNCYYTRNYGTHNIDSKQCMVIYNNDDWLAFREAVHASQGKSEVNAVLGADISVNTSVGYLDANPYCGYFNGNGHTLNVNIDSGTNYWAAPFVKTKGVTIKNLRVTGTVRGGLHSAGLIGGTNSAPVTIENVRVSVAITCTSTHAGGFIGHSGSTNCNIKNCLFDGSITSTGSGQYCGAIIGWENGGTSNVLQNCVENGTYNQFVHAGFCYVNPGNAWSGSNNNYSFHNWAEIASDKRNAGNIQLPKLCTILGEGWAIGGGTVVPSTTTTDDFGNQGTSVADLTPEQLATKLGDGWQAGNGGVYPVMKSEFNSYDYAVWDKRAKLQLRVNTHGEKGVESTIVDLSSNDEVLDKGTLMHELTRNCVDYTFDLLEIRASSPLSISGYDGDTLIIPVKKIETGERADYRFMNMNNITKLEPKRKQSSVQLTWTTSGGDSDFFRVLRRKHSANQDADWTDTLATNLTQMFYEDKTVLVQQVYDYRVESVLQCEGIHIAYATCSEECEPTGVIEGYLRMADGTAMTGDTVICRPNGIPGTDAVYKTISDDTGYYVFQNLPIYIGEDGTVKGEYFVTVQSRGNSGAYTGPNELGSVTFNQNNNWKQNFNFYMDTYFLYSGNVYFDTSSIPVPGVSFMLDGHPMHDASEQLITTDTQGAFTLSIPRGTHRVQAVKKGHRFANDGYLLNPDAPDDKRDYNFVKNVAGITIWDSTTVVLRGRVVGGDIEGSKPLGKSLSANNLGDSLKIVMQLEGDNASYIYRHPKDDKVKSISYNVNFGADRADTTKVTLARHVMTILPDAKTGEYELAVHPAKYKVTEVSAQGYPTLFQAGQIGQTVDLTFREQGDTCEYNRIYHSVPTVEVTQFNATGEKYFGVKRLTAQDNIGNKSDVNLVYYTKTAPTATDSTMHYSFGYPVFMAGSPYGIMLQACEKYYWNNDNSKAVDIVKLDQRGKIQIKNALTTDAETAEWECELDSAGGCSYIFRPDNTTFVMENDMALKSMDITLLYDGSYYDVKPFNGEILKGYVMALQPKKDGRKAIVAGTPKLWDILRDPPGGGSSAYIEEGSKLSYGYSLDVAATAGFSVATSTGTGADTYHGFVAAPGGSGETTGTLTHSKTEKGIDLKFEANFGYSWSWNYNMDITERIQTKSGAKWIGGKADLFIGTTENIIVQDAMAVRVIPDSMYQIVKTHEGGSFKTQNGVTVRVPVGTTKVLAQGIDDTGQPIYLVRDEVMSMSPTVKSTFIHSQEYIENELLPELVKIRNSLILPMGTDEAKAKKMADQRGYATYISTVPNDDDLFGLAYKVIRPNNETTGDSILALNEEMVTWVRYLAKNEQEKLSVLPSDLVKRYDFDGGAANIQYSETFTTAGTTSRYLRYPGLNGLGNLFAGTGPLAVIMKALEEKMERSGGQIDTQPHYNNYNAEDEPTTCEMQVLGSTWKTKWNLILYANANDKYNTSESHSKKVGFTLATGGKSSLTVDVYRSGSEYSIDSTTNVFNKLTVEMLNKVRYGSLTPPMLTFASFSNERVFSTFIFRTRGGATCQPYEEERVTKWYQPGTILDEATIPVDKPRIWIDEPVVSNVPYGEPARFTLHFANETDYPSQATFLFNYKLVADSNPKGARVCIDGKPIGSSDESIAITPLFDKATNKHNVFTKEITVYPSAAFDYEDLTLSLYDPEDPYRAFECKFSAHFIPSAGKVGISMPGDKWVINTESPYEGDLKQWYMPVRIDGFDVNWPNFDHVELQYKLSTQGDKDWVSVCAFYADKELRKKASGVTDTIPSNGIIMARFFGEKDPIEQHYDLRAAVFARHAGGFLTGYSDILTGVKDTRRPKPFGTPEPANGILDIGDDIKIAFSEPIAGNYLTAINNFEVLGTPASGDVATSTSLIFDGTTIAMSQSHTNLTGKNFTVNVMVNPTNDPEDMVIFTHGGLDGLTLGLTADRHLFAKMGSQRVESDKKVEFNGMLTSISYVIDQSGEGVLVTFFDGNTDIGSKQMTGKYEGNTIFAIGVDPYSTEHYFKGEMLEFRLWNRALKSEELKSVGRKQLTGFEAGLVNYYKLNEGQGDYSFDKAGGANDLWLLRHTWKRPSGLSLKFDGTKAALLDIDKFTRSKEHDYTMMFWFRCQTDSATLVSNGEARRGQDNQLNIGVRRGQLVLRSSGFEVPFWKPVSSGEWHHFAMTVSRSRNVANVYLDNHMIESFPADSLAGINGNKLALGATYVGPGNMTEILTGNIDEVSMFSSVLPTNLIEEYSMHTPMGQMDALMAYLNFGQSERQDDGSMRLMPTGVSVKRYMDNQGNLLPRRDTLLVDLDEQMFDRQMYAPMLSNTQQENLKYSWVARDNELLVNIDEPAHMIEKTNVYVTLKDVSDVNGNLMASPITLNLYVYRNPLRWDIKKVDKTIDYGTPYEFVATVKNLSGQRKNFEIQDLPLWINASQTSGTLNALDEQEITFTVSPFINIGTYNELISLTGDDMMSEPLPLKLRVRGSQPDWEIDPELKKQNVTMMMVARARIDGVVASSADDIIYVLDDAQRVMGVANVDVNNTSNANEALAYITIYGYTNSDGTRPTLNFKLYQASSGKVFTLTPIDEKTYTFERDAIIGTASEPIVLENDYEYVQTLHLNAGWNWVSLGVQPFEDDTTVKQFFGNYAAWEPDDIVNSVDGTKVQQWIYQEEQTKNARGETITLRRWTDEDKPIDVNPMLMYKIYSMSEKTIYLEGISTKFFDITLHQNWNRIAYNSTINLPISQALSDYTEKASEGDVIKSQNEFAIATRTGTGQLVWKGSLQYMETGKGYMLKRLAADTVSFSYPLYLSDNRYSGKTTAPRRIANHSTRTASTMNIVATISGVDIQAGDLLTVYNGADRLAEAVADEDGIYYLNIGYDNRTTAPLTFCIERGETLVAMTSSKIDYVDNLVLGMPNQPTLIDFAGIDPSRYNDGRWYTISGILLPSAPKQSGVYIHNGQIERIK